MTVSINTLVSGGGAGGAGGAGVAFGSDPTAVGSRGTPYTVNGVAWTVAYNGDGSVASYTVTLSGGLSLVRTVSYVDGFPIFSGAIEVAGATVMTLPQLKKLRDEVLVVAGAAARGFRARVVGANDTDALSWEIDSAGVKTYLHAVVEWDGQQLIAISNVKRATQQQATFVNTTGTSGALRTIVFPGWLMGIRNRLALELEYETGTATVAGTTGGGININAIGDVVGVGGSNTTGQMGFGKWLLRQRSTTSQRMHNGALSSGGYGYSSAPVSSYSINTETTDITTDFKLQCNTSTDRTLTLIRASVSMEVL